MRIVSAGILSLLTIGCGTGPEAARRDPASPSDVSYFISGFMVDSVLGIPPAGLKVAVGDSQVTLPANGSFRVEQHEEHGFINIDDFQFEPMQIPFAFTAPGAIRVQLRGTAPYALACEFRGGTVSAKIIDLQGRKTMDRRTRTSLSATINQQDVVLTGDRWLWTPRDNVTWGVAVTFPDTSFQHVTWRLEDLAGNVRTTSCERSVVCTQCQEPQ